MPEQQIQFDGRPDPMAEYAADCVRRTVVGDVLTWVHGYSGRDAADFAKIAQALSGKAEPSERQRQIAQVLCVCRTEPGGTQRTFTVPLGNAQLMRQCAEALEAGLPGRWVETVCQESDALALLHYVPAPDAAEGKQQALRELLADDQFWAMMDWLSMQIEGVPLRENDRPIGEVLTRASRDLEWRNRLIGVVSDMAAMAAGG